MKCRTSCPCESIPPQPSAGRPPLFRCLAIICLLMLGWGCRHDPASESRQSEQVGISVLVTTGMIADIARAVVGDAGSVTVLMGPGVDPHLYQPTTRDQRRLREAQVVFYNGLHLEGKMVEVFEALAREKPVIPIASGIPPERLLGGTESGGQHDPHVWFDVELWKLATEVVVDTLTAAVPEDAVGFRTRGDRYLEELESLDQYCRKRIADIPAERRVLITSHDAFQYFGRAYGFQVFGIQGISTESEAGLRRLAECVDLIRQQGVSAIFPESSVSPAAVQRVAQDSGARLGPELYSDALGPAESPEGTYRGMIRHNVDLIVEALRDPPP